MESKELYRHLLGINEPWTVEHVELGMTPNQCASADCPAVAPAHKG
jgi:hypothetical protein